MRISEGGFLKAILFASAVFGVGPHDDNYLFVEIIQFELCYHDERHPRARMNVVIGSIFTSHTTNPHQPAQGVISQDDIYK